MQEPVENQLIQTSPRGNCPGLMRAAFPVPCGQSGAGMALYHSGVLADIVIILGILGVFYGITQVGREWAGVLRPTVVIDLSFRALPRYTLFSLVRGLAAYCISFLFTIVYGYWAAKDRLAERLLVPILDILQSIPVLGFMPGVVLALVSVFPNSNTGLELAAVFMIFTGQAWNMTFSFYNSLKSVPEYLQEAGTIYHFNAWQRLTQIEMPYSAVGLIWNSMMSMAGGWFFLMVTEAFQLGNRDFRLPGIGSYMSVAVEKGNVPAMAAAVVAMVLMIVALDQLLWRPMVVWAQKFRIEDTSQEESMDSWFLDPPRNTPDSSPVASAPTGHGVPNRPSFSVVFARVLFFLLAAGLVFALAQVIRLLISVRIGEWLHLLRSDLLTLARVTAAIVLRTLWALPVGLRIGLSPKLSRIMQPIVQVAASFPAPMLFPAVILLLALLKVNIGFGSVVLMLLGTQWLSLI